tara:strand:+ start:92 stop:436 length:345 start_codon:yes stop_codon:yes gene_type:complete
MMKTILTMPLEKCPSHGGHLPGRMMKPSGKTHEKGFYTQGPVYASVIDTATNETVETLTGFKQITDEYWMQLDGEIPEDTLKATLAGQAYGLKGKYGCTRNGNPGRFLLEVGFY